MAKAPTKGTKILKTWQRKKTENRVRKGQLFTVRELKQEGRAFSLLDVSWEHVCLHCLPHIHPLMTESYHIYYSPAYSFTYDKRKKRGAWMAQSVKRPTSAQVMISQLVGSSRASASALRAWSLRQILRLPLSLPRPCSHPVHQKRTNIKKIFF